MAADEVPEAWERITASFEIIELDDVSEEIIHYAPKKNPGKLKDDMQRSRSDNGISRAT